ALESSLSNASPREVRQCASVQQQQAALVAESDRQVSSVQALFADARGQLGQMISSAQAQLQTDAESHLATLQQGHTTALGEVETTFTARREQAQGIGDNYADESLQAANSSAEQAQSRLGNIAAAARSVGQEKAQVGGVLQRSPKPKLR
ncbi:MAG: hypothetical protein HC886_14570, partial [Leptolyngbyaceae cyanobacterium SM1_1_3]|nr:hypothetical protein [Leptolyngbyaceae cyanobacterium SM1_1_3]